MGEMPWIVALVGGLVWIVATIIRAREEEQAQNSSTSGKPAGNSARARTGTDLDRFLREVHRRRQAGEQQETPQRAERPPVVVEPVAPRPWPIPLERPAAPARRLPRRPETESERQNIPTVIAVAQPMPVKQPSAAPELTALSVAPATLAATVVPAVAASAPLPTEVRENLDRLLHSSEGLRTVMVLQEVFAPPLCRRRR